MQELLLKIKPCKILICLREIGTNWNLTKIAKDTGTTFVYTSKVIEKLEQIGYVVSERKGKNREIKLSERGAKIATNLEEIMKEMQ